MAEFKKPAIPSSETGKANEISLDLSKSDCVEKNILNLPKAECPYTAPNWSDTPENQEDEYKFEVLKSGAILEEVKNLQNKPYWLIGRLEQNDIAMAHPTISRFHAVFQYRPGIENETNEGEIGDAIKKTIPKIESGWYVYDLGSTHGTFLNKLKIPPKTYIRVHVGHMLKFGASLRSYILQGPNYDEEPESELTVTELKERKKQEEELKKKQQQMQEEQREKEGISWGMGEDADEETDLSVNPYATTNNEELFLDDPKKTLRGYFEREGLNLEYKCDEMSPGTFVCRIELPIYDTIGKPISAEVCLKGRKKDCVAQCALEACRILDRQGVLRQSHHEPLKRKLPTADSDDEDDFLDRTGDIERKKLRKATAGQSVTLTYEDLIKEEEELNFKLSEVEKEIEKYHENSKRLKETKSNTDDDLDNYMENLTKASTKIDKTGIRKLRVEEQRLKSEILKVNKLIKIAKPFDLPPISGSSKSTNEKKTASLPLFGKRNKFKFTIEKKNVVTAHNSTKELKSDEEEFDEDDEESDDFKKEDTPKNLPIDNEDKIEKENDTKIIQSSENEVKNVKIKFYGPAVIQSQEISTESQETITESQEIALSNICADSNTESQKDEQEKKIIDKTKTDSNRKINLEDSKSDKVELIKEWVSKSPKPEEEPLEIDNNQVEEQNITKKSEKIEHDLDDNTDNLEIEDNNQTNIKRKNRTRNRHRRENVDIDDYEEYIDEGKHSNWVPPKNQSGDGRTSLNDKFGY